MRKIKHQKMKKIIVLLASILIIGLTYSSCAGKENESKNTVSEENRTTETVAVEATNEVITNATIDEETEEMVETEQMVEETQEMEETVEAETMEPIMEDIEEMEVTEIGRTPKISFTSTKFEAEPVKQGTLITHDYEFENTGEAPLIIESVKPSCGCMTVSFPKEVIASGHKGKIRVTFDSKGKEGMQRKSVTVKANTIPNAHVLSFFTEILIK